MIINSDIRKDKFPNKQKASIFKKCSVESRRRNKDNRVPAQESRAVISL